MTEAKARTLKSALKKEGSSKKENEYKRVTFAKKRQTRIFQWRLPETLWYQPFDFSIMRNQVDESAKAWRLKKPFGRLLDNVFEGAGDDCERFLLAFVSLADEDYHRGEERHCSKKHSKERRRLKYLHTEDVVLAYKIMMEDGLEAHVRDAKLGKFSRQRSETARVYAHRLAQADAIVAREGEKPELAVACIREMVSKISQPPAADEDEPREESAVRMSRSSVPAPSAFFPEQSPLLERGMCNVSLDDTTPMQPQRLPSERRQSPFVEENDDKDAWKDCPQGQASASIDYYTDHPLPINSSDALSLSTQGKEEAEFFVQYA